MKTAPILNVIKLGALAFAAAGLFVGPLQAADIIEEWAMAKVPSAPVLKSAKVDPKTTALLMLDFVKQGCNAERRPRCIASVPAVKKLVTEARAKKLLVIYTGFGKAVRADVLPELAPAADEQFLVSFLDKFIGTDLEKILNDRGIQTVITAGVAAHGAVLHTAASAALRNFNAVVPVDGMSAESLYAEQYTAWHLANAPVIPPKITLTRINMVTF
jgi:nicotinamidase-related amidase